MKTVIFTILISFIFVACAEKDTQIQEKECLEKGMIFTKIKSFNWLEGKDNFKYECR